MSKKLKRSAVALVLAATMVFSSQGVLTAFAAGGDIETGAPVSSALERSPDEGKTDVADESGNTDETETPEVTEPCGITEGCTLPNGHPGECQVAPVDPPVEDENGEGETQPCTKTEGCTLENGHEGECVTEPVTPPEEENGEDETQPCEKTEGCTLPNGHEGECVVEENTEDTEDTQEPSEEDVAAAKNVSDLIGALPEASTLDPETTDVEALAAQVKAAREAYDKLTDAQKALVEQTVLDKLVALEGALEALQNTNVAAEGDVAKVGDAYYSNIDDAIENAPENSTIELLLDDPDKTVEPTKTFYKSLTFTGTGTLKYDIYGWRYNGNLTFDGPNVALNCTTTSNAKAADNGEAGEWFIMVLNGSLNFTNGAKGTFSFDSKISHGNEVTNCAIYTNDNATCTINVSKGSSLKIWGSNTKGVNGQGIQLGRTSNSGIFVTDKSTFLIDGTNRGYVNSPEIYVEDSTFTVQNCTSNGSNGGEFTAINSTITYQNNNGHGLSAGNVTIKNSTVDCNNNAYYGLTYSGDMTMDSTSKINANGNGYGYTGGGLRAYGTSTVEAGAVINILNNKRNGMEQYGDFVFKEGSEITVTGNNEPSTNGGGIFNNGTLTLPSNATITNNSAAQTGGGICNADTVTIPTGVQLYNNHAGNAGDDIYNRENATITFTEVGSDWVLDDCDHAITGWFDDSKDNRWEAHYAPYHAEEFDEFEKLTSMATITGLHALKAAHGIDPIDPGEPGGGDWDVEHSKSKTATPLDANYESDVTLSLPSAEEQLESDVVFVLDKSTSTDIEDEALAMLEDLQGQIAQTGAKVNVGVVIFNKEANRVLELTELTEENMSRIEEAIRTTMSSGTNTHAGLLAGKAMLDADTLVDSSRKYLVFVSDAITYMYNSEPTAINLQNGDKTNVFAGPDNWMTKYGNNNAPANGWATWFSEIKQLIDQDGNTYEAPYGGEYTDFVYYDDRANHAMSIDKALYLTNEVYQSAKNAGYHCYAMKATSNADHPWASNFMDYLANGQEVSFEDIQNDIFYLLDAGSSVVDVIGYGTDNAGNEYNFDFVDNLDNLKITVGGNELDEEDIIDPQFNDPYVTSAYGFSDPASGRDGYDFVLKYYQKGQDGNSDECFVWEINVPVSNFAPVQLTYTVKLTNPQTAEGTYGEYDANGENGSTSLYTNKEATLYPVDSNGDSGVPENFPKPTVSYTVGGNDNPGTDPTPDPDPDPDRPSRPNRDDDDDWEPLPDAPVKDKPTTEVDVPEETETPTTEQPDKYNPETGDTTTVFAAMALAAVSLGGVVLLGRKKK